MVYNIQCLVILKKLRIWKYSWWFINWKLEFLPSLNYNINHALKDKENKAGSEQYGWNQNCIELFYEQCNVHNRKQAPT